MSGGQQQELDRKLVTLARPGVVSLLLGAGLAFVYLGTLTSNYAFDGVSYSIYVLLALLGKTSQLFQANHLLYGPVAYLWAVATGGATASVELHVRLQILQALLGGTAIGLLHLLLRRFVAAGPALAASLGVAFTYAFWHFATDVEVYCLSALLLVVAFGPAVTAIERAHAGWAAAAGALAGLAALGHIAHAIFGVATGLVLLACAPRGRLLLAVAFGTAAAAVVAAGLLPLAFGPFAVVASGEGSEFVLGYARSGSLGRYLTTPWARLDEHVRLASHAMFHRSPPTWRLVAAGVCAGLALVSWRARGERDRPARTALTLATAWATAHALFFVSWEPSEKYWVAFLVPGAVIAALGLDALTGRARPALRAAALVALPLTLLAWNAGPIADETDPARNRQLTVARLVGEVTPKDAAILLSGTGEFRAQKVYIPRFAYRKAIDLELILRGPDPRAGLDELAAHVRSGAERIYVLSELIDDTANRRRLEEKHGLPPGAIAAALPRELFRPVGRLGATPLFLYERRSPIAGEPGVHPRPRGPE